MFRHGASCKHSEYHVKVLDACTMTAIIQPVLLIWILSPVLGIVYISWQVATLFISHKTWSEMTTVVFILLISDMRLAPIAIYCEIPTEIAPSDIGSVKY